MTRPSTAQQPFDRTSVVITRRVRSGCQAAYEAAEGRTKTAPRYKTAFLIWVAVFPTVLVFSTLLSRLPFEMPRVLSVFVVTALAIPVVVYILLPRLTRLAESWLYRLEKTS